jgi:hypothetical protein
MRSGLKLSALMGKLGFREDPRGANLWLVVANDAGVFQEARLSTTMRCVHPVQAYLDLRSIRRPGWDVRWLDVPMLSEKVLKG